MTTSIEIDGAVLELDQQGTGDAILLIHCGALADGFLPLMTEPALSRYRRIRYRRRGYGGSRPTGPASIADHAADCRGLLAALGIERAHVVGHSIGGAIALQLAADAPTTVETLVLLEPSVLAVPAAAEAREVTVAAVERFMAGDAAGAVDRIYSVFGGPDWQNEMARTVPDGPTDAVRDAAAFFASDLVALRSWDFGTLDAARLTQPVLYLLSSDCHPVYTQNVDLLRSWIPHMQVNVVDQTNHLLHMQRPTEVATLLAGFLARQRTTI